ncbi:MAG: hypothetical protein EO766_09265 [Hydrotalea sp. AMD]|uniref:hypothetical protein n=1 Tax=Hydrotalea sp. AMD TaxID=2501297 RepID=UPI000943B213|nr:hypothetical protein [Hydrotalea sp. AMD]RWZ88170.1 MAG: hypothetical protein EO766_09265 [Hydrotalea sp. AMD]
MRRTLTLIFLLSSILSFAQADSSKLPIKTTVKTDLTLNTKQHVTEMTNADKIAFSSLIVAWLSFILTIVTIFQTRKHNRNSLKPIINVNPFDYSNCILIELVNEGVGSAIIKKITVEKNDYEKKQNVYSWMPDLPEGISYQNYLTRDRDIPMQAGKVIKVIEIKNDVFKDTQRKFREEMRGVLRQLTIKIEYTDVYESKFPIYTRKLDLYARTDNG